jgi:hypothetical protein
MGQTGISRFMEILWEHDRITPALAGIMPAVAACHKRVMNRLSRHFPKATHSDSRKEFAGLGGKDDLSADLLELCGADGFAALTDRFGGRRLFVAKKKLATAIGEALGEDLAAKLSLRYGGSYLRVPLARAFRAERYRSAGESNGWIATKLGLTETAVNKIFAALKSQTGGRA